jgi:hypothetical protein
VNAGSGFSQKPVVSTVVCWFSLEYGDNFVNSRRPCRVVEGFIAGT